MPRRKSNPQTNPNASRRYHDRVASRYDQIYDDAYWRFHDELTWRHIKPHLPRDANAPCLDLGCGTGKWGLRLLKSGFPTTFLDHSPAMIDETREKLATMGPREKKATTLVADIIDLTALPADHFSLTLAMGDPLSICSDPPRAVREIHRVCRPGGIVIATADAKLAAIDHFIEKNDLDALESFLRTGRTQWLTANENEQFNLAMFTPRELHHLFESAGFHVLSLIGKTILPIRKNQHLLADDRAMERLLKLELDLSKDPSSAARASHLQISAKKL